MALEINLKIVGALLIALGIAHGAFGKRFEWKADKKPSSDGPLVRFAQRRQFVRA